MRVAFSDDAWEEYLGWFEDDRKVLDRINRLIAECRRTPFRGTGKPEPLKNNYKGWWSRRINQADRLVYRVTGTSPDQVLEIIQCRSHY